VSKLIQTVPKLERHNAISGEHAAKKFGSIQKFNGKKKCEKKQECVHVPLFLKPKIILNVYMNTDSADLPIIVKNEGECDLTVKTNV
jgi:hypothetical protein